MIIYVEKQIFENEITQNILAKFKNPQIIKIDNYKNIFDKNVAFKTKPFYIIAKVNKSIGLAPLGYGHPGGSYFLKNSLGCVFDCKYCYLKGAFKNDFKVIFVNYEDIKKEISETLEKSPHKINWFYSSDYSDNLAINNLTNFCEEFIPFFENFPNAMMEIRTKSHRVENLLKLGKFKNTEIAFSLNPSEIIQSYEKGVSSLDKRISAINKLLENDIKVGIRFIPLIGCENYKEIYSKFLDEIKEKIDFSKIYSIFIGGLLYTSEDYKTILKKHPFEAIYELQKEKDGFYRQNPEVRKWFYEEFRKKLGNCQANLCLDFEI